MVRRIAQFSATFGLALALLVAIPTPGAIAADPIFDWWNPGVVDPPANVNVALSDVDALGPSNAWAVGSREITPDVYGSFVMQWTGSSWDAVDTSAFEADGLSAVLAKGSGDVFVGGTIGDTQAVFAHFDGTSWADLPTPAGAVDVDELEAVGASEVWAVADHGTGGSIDRWDGASWSVQALPAFPDQDSIDIADIEARSATDVWVTGRYHDSVALVNKAVAIRWDGSAWIDMAPPADLASLGALTLVGPTDAYAEARALVGAQTVTTIQHWDGLTWSSMNVPLTGQVDVRAMGSTSADDIWAVGEVSNGNDRGFMAHSDGTSWQTWQPTTTTSSLDGLSFPSASTGFAVGAIGNQPGTQVSSYVFGAKIEAVATSPEVGFGQPTTVQGTLSFKDGQDASGVTIHAERTDRDDVTTTLGDVTTGAGGSFSFEDTPATVGTNTYRLTSVLDGVHTSALGSATVDVERRSTSIVIHASPRSINFGHTTKITAQLAAFEPDSVIEIWALKPGGGRTLQRRHMVDGDGTVSVTVKPKANTRYEANSKGDDTWEPAETRKPITVGVRPDVDGVMTKAYGIAGAYRLYHYAPRCPSGGVGCPRFQGHVTPEHRKCFVVRFQQQTGGGWSTIDDGCFQPDQSSSVTLIIVYGDRRVIGDRFRMRTEFQGDNDHLPANSSWAYFRVTD